MWGGGISQLLQHCLNLAVLPLNPSPPHLTPTSSLSAGDYFGEMALMLDEPRHANVIAVGPCKCLSLDRSDFDELLGPLQEVISAQMRIRILRRWVR